MPVDPAAVTSVADGLRAVGFAGSEPPRRPVLRAPTGTLVTLATLGAGGALSWRGLWVTDRDVRALGPAVPPSLLALSSSLPSPTDAVVNLIQAAAGSYVERLEEIGVRLDTAETRPTPPPISELSGLVHDLARVHKHLARLAVLLSQLEGPLGLRFPGLEGAVPALRGELSQVQDLSAGLSQVTRDLTSLRSASESNRLAEAANELGQTSNRIAAFANTSNVRMLGVAYVALLLALVSAVVLIPNTAATILGMPSAAWVPGLWVDALLVVLAVVPIVVVFSRGWVRRMLRDWGGYQERTSEGLRDLPEISVEAVARPSSERLIRQSP